MIVTFTKDAEADFERIADYIAEDNPTRALSFVGELRVDCEKLVDMPERFPLILRYEHTGVRRMVRENYLIFYRLTGEAVEILHILHGARNYEEILFPRE